MKFNILIVAFCLTLGACENSKQAKTEKKVVGQKAPPPFPKPQWVDSPRLSLAIDSNLSFKGKDFKSDSVIIVSYNGAFGENSYTAVNDKGQWITTVKNKKKLTTNQLKTFHKIICSPTSFKNPLIIGCYEPRIGVLYFKQGEVIAQSAICLDCARMKSTAKLGSNNHYESFNKIAVEKLWKFYDDLKM